MPKTIIRPATVKDVPQLLPLFREAVLSIPDYSPKMRRHFMHKYRREIVMKRIHDKAAYCLVAEQGKVLIGFCWGMRLKPTDDGVYWMNWIGVSATSRRQGVAGKILKRLESDLKNNRFHKLWFNIDPKNKRSAATFRALRYHQIARVKHHWYGQDALLWENEIFRRKNA